MGIKYFLSYLLNGFYHDNLVSSQDFDTMLHVQK